LPSRPTHATLHLLGHRFADLAKQHERALVGDAEIARESEGALALHLIAEDRDVRQRTSSFGPGCMVAGSGVRTSEDAEAPMRFGLDAVLDPIWHAEATLDELLADPALRLLMDSDGVDEAGLRELAAEIGARVDGRPAPPNAAARRSGAPRICLC